MKHKFRILPLLLALTLFIGSLSGCIQDVRGGEEVLPEVSANLEQTRRYAVDSVFSLNCNRQYSFNPMATPDVNNVLCTQLMYDNIFEVDSSFTVSSEIIADYESPDGVHWYFTVDTSVKFWDGTTLTAYDVAYSIQRAQHSSRLRGRLSTVWGASAQSEERFAVTLSGANTQFPALLTIPVIKDGSIEETAPMGTGPFMPNEELTQLTLFEDHRKAADIPIDVIYLKEITEIDKAISSFESAEIDLVANDPTGILNLGYGSANDIRYYPTTNMHYIGFNSEKLFFSSEACRRAMTYIINREHIVNDIMKGAATEAALPMNPASPLYNNSYADIVSYSVKKSEAALEFAQVKDYDDDGYLEAMITGIPVESDTIFIVCSDNAQKVAAAKSIADNLIALGIKVVLKELPWDEYLFALNEGDFDMYYAEAMLTADFNPSQLLLKGAPLNYGKFSDTLMAEKIGDYMSASEDERKMYADFMNKYITETAMIVPICFEKHQVISQRGVISGMKPSQYNMFQNIFEWIIDLE